MNKINITIMVISVFITHQVVDCSSLIVASLFLLPQVPVVFFWIQMLTCHPPSIPDLPIRLRIPDLPASPNPPWNQSSSTPMETAGSSLHPRASPRWTAPSACGRSWSGCGRTRGQAGPRSRPPPMQRRRGPALHPQPPVPDRRCSLSLSPDPLGSLGCFLWRRRTVTVKAAVSALRPPRGERCCLLGRRSPI